MSADDVLTEAEVRRLEVFTEARHPRQWTAEAKARIVAESYASSVGLSPSGTVTGPPSTIIRQSISVQRLAR